ncbi:trans-sulfuration enzyme family protein [Idiomarina zobellii]|uniref:Cystathionine gamma-synthase n=1 Tax=Idiomarina zobellii TaxID=86103 RepID=A0A837ND06_9GAMM|nr:aminotransferase class I/II-fold pyridoxal phosphate-dependent enzyme [Idiomarina zobellii]KPD22049.1 cystathionine gamma-synthase [Idiomarina zobellii]SDG24380.1 cystathionine gamma-synthase [Idiomarina zobellii]
MTTTRFSSQSVLAQGGINKYIKDVSIIPPVYTSTTYLRDSDNQYRSGLVYSRADNPTYRPAEKLLAELENAVDARLFASGMAAATAVFQALKPGDSIIAPKVMYWALRQWLKTFGQDTGLHIRFVDTSNLEELQESVNEKAPTLIWLETPGNPLWTVTDIEAVSAIAKSCGALLAVDSTVATPLLTKPLDLSADIVMHSATKYLNGHSDVISGALAARENNEFWQRLVAIRAQSGAVPSPQDASQLLRGMRTLFLRVRESCQNALYIAEQLEQHPNIVEVLYPGLKSFAGHEVAAKQMQGGFGGMLSIRLAGGEKAAIAVAAQTQLWHRATSLGGVESLIEHRASIEGPDTPVPSDLLRLSVGIESADDLLKDLQQAIDSAHA